MNAIFVMLNGPVSVRNFYIGLFTLLDCIPYLSTVSNTAVSRSYPIDPDAVKCALGASATVTDESSESPMYHSYGTSVLPTGVILSFTHDRQMSNSLIYKMIDE